VATRSYTTIPDEIADWMELCPADNCEEQSGLIWRRPRGKVKAGDRVGSVVLDKTTGLSYWRTKFDYKLLSVGRIVYKLAHGVDLVDHVVGYHDGDPLNNNVDNLFLKARVCK